MKDSGHLSPARRRGFTVAMLLIPVAAILLLEGVLRLGGYGEDFPLFHHREMFGQAMTVVNPDVTRRYF